MSWEGLMLNLSWSGLPYSLREREVEMLYFIASGGVPMLLSVLVNDNTYAIGKVQSAA